MERKQAAAASGLGGSSSTSCKRKQGCCGYPSPVMVLAVYELLLGWCADRVCGARKVEAVEAFNQQVEALLGRLKPCWMAWKHVSSLSRGVAASSLVPPTGGRIFRAMC